MPASRASNPGPWTLAAAALALLHSLFLGAAFRWNNVDDAYIAFRYGWHLVRGQGLVYNAGERVEGYTSFLWTVITAPFTAGPIDVSTAAIVLGLLASLAAFAGIAHLCAHTTGEPGGARWPYAALFLVACDGAWAFWAVAGLETALFGAFVVWSVVVIEKPREGPLPLAAGLLLGLATLTRPEGALLFALAVADRVFRGGRHRAADLRALAMGWAALVLPQLAFRRLYYGAWVPNTFQAKVTLGAPAIGAGISYAWSFVAWRLGVPLLALASISAATFRRWPPLRVTFPVAFVAYIVAVGGDWPIASRFFVPVIPFVAIAVAWAIARFVREPRWRGLAFAAAAALTLAGTFARGERIGMILGNDNVGVESRRKAFGIWLRDALPAGTLIAVGPAGAIPYYSRLPSLDAWGLTNAHMARATRVGFEPGHDRFDPAYILSRNPALIVGAMWREPPPGYALANPRIPGTVMPLEPVFAKPDLLR